MQKIVLLLAFCTFKATAQTYNPLTNTATDITELNAKSIPTAQPPMYPDVLRCSTDFWTVDTDNNIRLWSLNGGQVSGGDTVLQNANMGGLAYCDGGFATPKFFCSNFPDNGIIYSTGSGWDTIPTDHLVLNNGGNGGDMYFTSLAGGFNRVLEYFNAGSLSVVADLSPDYITVADIAVDSLGQAWVFTGTADSFTNSELRVYNRTGLVNSYSLTFDTYNNYGTFFLNDVLYVGFSSAGRSTPNALVPIVINNTTAQLGTPIPFTNPTATDLASCGSFYTPVATEKNSSENNLNISPNPTNGIVRIQTKMTIQHIDLYNLNGQKLLEATTNSLDLTHLPQGVYILNIQTKQGIFYKKIVR